MHGRPLKGPFSNFFYKRLRAEGIKPRRVNNPQPRERYSFSVAQPRGEWKRDLYYDPRALRNLDHALELLPQLRKPMFTAFGDILEHEKVHVGASEYQAYPGKKIRRIAKATGREATATLLIEQVAHRGTIQRILKSHDIKSLQHPKAKKVLSDRLSWYIIRPVITSGLLMQLAGSGSHAAKTIKETRRRRKKLRSAIKKELPTLPEEIIAETIRKAELRLVRLVEQAHEKMKK